MKKKCSVRHEGTTTKFCTGCGALTESEAAPAPNPNCIRYHAEYKSWGYKYCPDCGERL